MSVGKREHEIVHDGMEMSFEPGDYWGEMSTYVSMRPHREECYRNWCRLMEFDPEDTQSMVAYELAVAS
jgi:hypothetical protein